MNVNAYILFVRNMLCFKKCLIKLDERDFYELYFSLNLSKNVNFLLKKQILLI